MNLCGGIRSFLIIVNQHDSGQTKQVEQVYADTQTGQVGDEDNPTVAVRLVGYVFPLQYQPENNGGEQGGESVYFAFYG